MNTMNDISITEMEKAQGGAGLDLLTGEITADPIFPVFNPAKDWWMPVPDLILNR